MINKNKDNLTVAEKELTAIRIFKAPRNIVWEMWTNPEHITHWWGPQGFSTTTFKMELKPGGVWRFVMHGPDGRDYQNKVVYIDVVEQELLIYKHSGEEDTEDINFHVTVNFEESEKETKLTMKMVFETHEELERVSKEFGAIEGLKQTLERLDNYLSR